MLNLSSLNENQHTHGDIRSGQWLLEFGLYPEENLGMIEK